MNILGVMLPGTLQRAPYKSTRRPLTAGQQRPAACDRPVRLTRSAVTCVKVRGAAEAARAAELISGLDGVLMVREEPVEDSMRTLLVESAADRDLRNEIIVRLIEEKLPIVEIYSRELSLEDIFLQLVTEEVS